MTLYLIQSHPKNLILHSKLWLCIWYRVILLRNLHIVHCCGSDSDFCLCDCQARSYFEVWPMQIKFQEWQRSQNSHWSNPQGVPSHPATDMHLYKTMFYTLKDPIPFNAPPPPDCKSCKKQGSLFVILPPPGRQLKIRFFSLSPTEKSVFPKPATVS